ncbi:MAG: hypothetical protein MI924_14415 [Chloroflexales bacterium]|nr:hypothetical protein [Chloroflexales bacterium]
MVWIDFLMITFALVIAWLAWMLANPALRKPSLPLHHIDPATLTALFMLSRKRCGKEVHPSFLDTYDGSHNNG